MTGSDRRNLIKYGAMLFVASLPAVFAPGVVASAAGLAGEYAAKGSWWPTTDPLLIYVAVPVVSLSACVLFLAPGLLITRVTRRHQGLASWLFQGFVVSIGLVSVFSALVQQYWSGDLRGTGYGMWLLGLLVAAAVLGWLRTPARRSDFLETEFTHDKAAFAVLALGVCLYFVLAPKLLFESFNGDGAHAFESSRLLLSRVFPFWPSEAGPVAGFPGTTSMLFAFPNAWFLRLFGESEYSVRIPFLLYVPVLGAGVLTAARLDRPGAGTSTGSILALCLSLAAYALAMAFSATYSPYSADVALPATQDTLLMIAAIGVVIAAVRREPAVLLYMIALAVASLPSGLMLIVFWLLARWLVIRPRDWGEMLPVGVGLVLVMVLAAMLPGVLSAVGAAPPGGEYGLVGVLSDFAFLQFVDVSRIRYAAIPAGIFPIVALLAWRAQDSIARTVTLMVAAYFLFFFVQAHISLHHFVPAMVLPMVVALRVVDGRPRQSLVWCGLAAIGVILALPAHFSVHQAGRTVGSSVLERVGNYGESDPVVTRASTLLNKVLPYDWEPAVPDNSYGGSPLVWNHYAQHGSESQPAAETNYILQESGAALPDGWRVVADDSLGAQLLVRSDSVTAVQLALRPAHPAGSPWLGVKRSILFRSVPHSGWPPIVSVVDILEAVGIDTAPILERLGVDRSEQ